MERIILSMSENELDQRVEEIKNNSMEIREVLIQLDQSEEDNQILKAKANQLKERLKEMRDDVGMSMLEVDAKTGIKTTKLFSYETGKRNPTVIEIDRLAELYKTTPEYLLGLRDEKEPRSSNMTQYLSDFIEDKE